MPRFCKSIVLPDLLSTFGFTVKGRWIKFQKILPNLWDFAETSLEKPELPHSFQEGSERKAHISQISTFIELVLLMRICPIQPGLCSAGVLRNAKSPGDSSSDLWRDRCWEGDGITDKMPRKAFFATLWSMIPFFTPAGLSCCFLFSRPSERCSWDPKHWTSTRTVFGIYPSKIKVFLFYFPLLNWAAGSGCLLSSLAWREGDLSSQLTTALVCSALSKSGALTQPCPMPGPHQIIPAMLRFLQASVRKTTQKITRPGLRHGDGEEGEGNKRPSFPQTEWFFFFLQLGRKTPEPDICWLSVIHLWNLVVSTGKKKMKLEALCVLSVKVSAAWGLPCELLLSYPKQTNATVKNQFLPLPGSAFGSQWTLLVRLLIFLLFV